LDINTKALKLGLLLFGAIIILSAAHILFTQTPSMPKEQAKSLNQSISTDDAEKVNDTEYTVAKLMSLPYIEWSEDDKNITIKGVTYYDSNLSYPGLNLYNSRFKTEAYIIDMEGRLIQNWSIPSDGPTKSLSGWHHIILGENRSLYAIQKGEKLLKIDRDSNIVWSLDGVFHHDVTFGPDGVIYSISNNISWLDYPEGRVPVLDDLITVVSPDGKLMRIIPLVRLFKDRIKQGRINQIRDRLKNGTINSVEDADSLFDVLHTNSIVILKKDIPTISKAGDALISMRQLDTIAIIDMDNETVEWAWGPGIIDKQHHATYLDNGDILVYDNGVNAKRSRIVEMDPNTGEIKWQYDGSDEFSFFSQTRGAAQRLPNGNTLITESDEGHAFEITLNGTKVWEFLNPDTFKKSRGAIYRMQRIPIAT
jgi:hypothetical protein